MRGQNCRTFDKAKEDYKRRQTFKATNEDFEICCRLLKDITNTRREGFNKRLTEWTSDVADLVLTAKELDKRGLEYDVYGDGETRRAIYIEGGREHLKKRYKGKTKKQIEKKMKANKRERIEEYAKKVLENA